MSATQEEIMAFRKHIEELYRNNPTGCGDTFDEILAYEIHIQGTTFKWLAEEWDVTTPFIGEVIADHCNKL